MSSRASVADPALWDMRPSSAGRSPGTAVSGYRVNTAPLCCIFFAPALQQFYRSIHGTTSSLLEKSAFSFTNPVSHALFPLLCFSVLSTQRTGPYQGPFSSAMHVPLFPPTEFPFRWQYSFLPNSVFFSSFYSAFHWITQCHHPSGPAHIVARYASIPLPVYYKLLDNDRLPEFCFLSAEIVEANVEKVSRTTLFNFPNSLL